MRKPRRTGHEVQGKGHVRPIPLPIQSFHIRASLRGTPGRSAAQNVTSVMSPLLLALPPPPPERGWEATAGQQPPTRRKHPSGRGRVGPARPRAPLHVAIYFRPRLPASQRISAGSGEAGGEGRQGAPGPPESPRPPARPPGGATASGSGKWRARVEGALPGLRKKSPCPRGAFAVGHLTAGARAGVSGSRPTSPRI